jgi:predicted RNase H-like HicB family nuclease
MTSVPKVLNFKVIVEQDEDGWFIAGVPAIPGCHTQGKTYEEAVKNIGEAIGLCLEEAKENRDYRQQIVWPEEEKGPRFLGVIDLPVKVTFAT